MIPRAYLLRSTDRRLALTQEADELGLPADSAKSCEEGLKHTLRVDGLTIAQMADLAEHAAPHGARIAAAEPFHRGGEPCRGLVVLADVTSLRRLAGALADRDASVSRAISAVLGVLARRVPVLRFRSVEVRLPGGADVALMGILNVTPDSFSDGGLFTDPGAAVEHACRMVEEGACIIDVGGESTRPGAEPVGVREEMERTIPVLGRLRAVLPDRVVLSIDTMKAAVARGAVEAGAEIINDVSALTADPEMPRTVARLGVHVILNHMKGRPRTMQESPRYGHVIPEVIADLTARVTQAIRAGVDAEKIILDPGIGFGKRRSDNAAILRHLPAFVSLGSPVAVGVSRKSFLGRLVSDAGGASAGRSESTTAAEVFAVLGGAHILRTHEPARARRAARVAGAIATTIGGDGETALLH
ncbi:MAG: dihydropteroate synthase [Acidobacteriota bacterium]